MGKKSRQTKQEKQLSRDKKEFAEKFEKAFQAKFGAMYKVTKDSSLYLELAVKYEMDDMILLLRNKNYLGTNPNQRHVVSLAIQQGAVTTLDTLLSCNKIDPYAHGLCPTEEAYTIYNIEHDKVIPIIGVLINHGIDIDLPGKKDGLTILQRSIMTDTKSISKQLIKWGADINARTIYNLDHKVTLLQFVIGRIINYYDIIKDYSNTTQEITKQQILIEEHFEIFEYILKEGADPNIKCESMNGMQALHMAALLGSDKGLKLLLKTKKIDLNALDDIGYSALHHCIARQNIEAFKLLISKGADYLIKDCEGYNLLSHACLENKLEIANFIGQTTPDLQLEDGAMTRIIIRNSAENIKNFIDNYYHISQHQIQHSVETVKSGIYWSAAKTKNSVFNLALLKKMCNVPTIKEILAKNNFFIYELAYSGATKYLKEIIDMGADVNMADLNDIPPLFHAMSNKQEFTSIALIKNDAKTNFVTNDGASLLHIALLYGLFRLAQKLHENNPEMYKTPDKNDATIIDYAISGGFENCIEWAIQHYNAQNKDEIGIEPEIAENIAEKKSDVSTNDKKITSEMLESFISSYTQDEKHKFKISAIYAQADKRLAEQRKQNLEKIEPKTQQVEAQESWYLSEGKQYQEEDCITISVANKAKQYVAISKETIEILRTEYKGQADEVIQKFTNAIEHGYVGQYGKNGIKTIGGCLLELKLVNENFRLYTKEIYKNPNGSQLIVFDKFAKTHDKLKKQIDGTPLKKIEVDFCYMQSSDDAAEAPKISRDQSFIAPSFYNDSKHNDEYKEGYDDYQNDVNSMGEL